MNGKNDKSFSNFNNGYKTVPNFKYYNELGEEYAEELDERLSKNQTKVHNRVRKGKKKNI